MINGSQDVEVGLELRFSYKIIKSLPSAAVEGELASSVNVLLKIVEIPPQRHPTSLEKKLQKDGAWAAKKVKQDMVIEVPEEVFNQKIRSYRGS